MSPLAMWLSAQLVAAAVLTFVLWRNLISHRERQSYERFITRWKNEAKRLAGRLELSEAEVHETLDSRNHWYDKYGKLILETEEFRGRAERAEKALDEQKTITDRWITLASENSDEITALREQVKGAGPGSWYYSPSTTIPYQGAWSFTTSQTGGPIA